MADQIVDERYRFGIDTEEGVENMLALADAVVKYQDAIKNGQSVTDLAIKNQKDLADSQKDLGDAIKKEATSLEQLINKKRALVGLEATVTKGSAQQVEIKKELAKTDEALAKAAISQIKAQKDLNGTIEVNNKSFNALLTLYQLQSDQIGKLTKDVEKLSTTNEKATKAQEKNSKSILDMVKGVSLFGVSIGDVVNKGEEWFGNLTNIGNKLKEVSALTDGQTKKVGALGKGFGSGAKTATILFRSMNLLKAAFIGTGIGALIVALTSLAAFFLKNREGANQLSIIMAKLGAAVDVVVDRAAALGKILFEAFNDPKQAVEDFGSAILKNVTNRFTAVLDLAGAIGTAIKAAFTFDGTLLSEAGKNGAAALAQIATGLDTAQQANFINGLKSINEEINKEVEAAGKLEAARQRLEEQEIRQIVRSARLRRDLKEQNLIVEDITKSYEERIAAAEKVAKIEEELLKSELRLLDGQISNLRARQALGDTSIEDERALAELIAKRYQLEESVLELKTTNQNKLNQLLREENEERKKTLALAENSLNALEKRLQELLAQFKATDTTDLEALKTVLSNIEEQKKLLDEAAGRIFQVQRELDPIDIEPLKQVFAELESSGEESENKIRANFLASRLRARREDFASVEEFNAARRRLELAFEKELLEFKIKNSEEFSNERLELLNQLADVNTEIEITARPKFDEARAKTNELVSDIAGLSKSAIDVIDGLFDRQIARYDQLVDKQRETISNIESNSEDFNARQLGLEKERLRELEEERKKAQDRQLALDKIAAQAQIVVNTALAVSNLQLAVTKTAGQSGGGAVITVPIVLAVVAGLISTVANLIPAPSFYEGTDSVPLGRNPKGRDTIPAWLHEGEGVLQADKNRKYSKTFKAMRREAIPPKLLNGFVDAYQKNNLEGYLKNMATFEPDLNNLLKSKGINLVSNNVFDTKKVEDKIDALTAAFYNVLGGKGDTGGKAVSIPTGRKEKLRQRLKRSMKA